MERKTHFNKTQIMKRKTQVQINKTKIIKKKERSKMSPWRKTHFNNNNKANTRGQKSIKQKLYHNAQIIQWSLTIKREIEIYTAPRRRS